MQAGEDAADRGEADIGYSERQTERIEKGEGAEVWHGEARQPHSDTAFVVSV